MQLVTSDGLDQMLAGLANIADTERAGVAYLIFGR